jgi:hypothetical protein
MKPLFLLLALLFSSPAWAELFKCTTGSKTAYQDKPCQNQQIQAVIAPAPPVAPASVPIAKPDSSQISRDARGRIKRSEKAKDDFKEANPCPANRRRSGACPGYVIDHINPLACGGADSPENMQWQTVAAGKEKDGWERDNCRYLAKQPQSYSDAFLPQPANVAVQQDPEIVYTGRRGGHYVMTKQGKKRYLKHK